MSEKTVKINNQIELKYFYRPGELLDDLKLTSLYKRILKINKKHKIQNNALNEDLSLEQIRDYYANTLVSEVYFNQNSTGFLISPLLENSDGLKILHTGLMIIDNNPGANLMSLLGVGNFIMAYEMLGNIYVTNITSKPTAIENFTKVQSKAWPAPGANLIRPPKNYRDVLEVLETQYLKKYFPNNGAGISIDKKRFIMKSDCLEMGFDSSFQSATKASSLECNNFCHMWISYEDQEDLIQVSSMTLLDYLKNKLIFAKLCFDVKSIKVKSSSPPSKIEIKLAQSS